MRIPWGPVWAVLGIGFSLVLLAQIDGRKALLMLVTAGIAAANWWWAKRRWARALATAVSLPAGRGTRG
ncbi:MAG: hypothetical protein KGL02_07195 [Acidobacteriota bacterium]|nr:hypothetical protein [Acidobacteriota bacterium]MDE3170505.1 hypothetical protein [Acidobacteriota bacterium]